MLYTFGDAAIAASSEFGIEVSTSDLELLVSMGVLPEVPTQNGLEGGLRLDEVRRLAGKPVMHVTPDGLFSDLGGLLNGIASPPMADAPPAPDSVVFLRLGSDVGISFQPLGMTTARIQVFVTALRARGLLGRYQSPQGTLWSHDSRRVMPINLEETTTLWSTRPLDEAEIRRLWQVALSHEATPASSDVLTVPSLYGNKSRMAAFLAAVVRNYMPIGGVVCDLMSGTGVVTRALGAFYDVYANDANPYASLLTGWRDKGVTAALAEDLFSRVEAPYQQNLLELRALFAAKLEQEARFLHGATTLASLAAYRDFCDQWPRFWAGQREGDIPCNMTETDSRVLKLVAEGRRLSRPTYPYCMAAAYYANAYFGLAQAMAIDSLRFAIDQIQHPRLHDVGLAALLMTACSCASWTHFAQPPKLHTLTSMRQIIERRARDVFSEFGMILQLLAAPRPDCRLRGVWNTDWRDALARFQLAAQEYPVDSRAVYVDPPYGKMQYSRYYHVLNALVEYTFPVCSGSGRCPPRHQRFSSRFEYQPGPAAREFSELLRSCGELGMTAVVSYSDKGFVPIRTIVDQLECHYRHVHLYCLKTRHHFQGKRRNSGRDQVREYVLVGSQAKSKGNIQ